jgi:hypothetical protein
VLNLVVYSCINAFFFNLFIKLLNAVIVFVFVLFWF